MFSVQQKREIADAVQKILMATKHPELPTGEVSFVLNVSGAEPWSWALIYNNGAVTNPGVNPWNEQQAARSEAPVRASGAQETFDQMDVRIKAEMREEEIEEGIRCDCGVRAGISHFCSALDHWWIGAARGNR